MTRNPFEEMERAFDRIGRQLEGLAPELNADTLLVDVADTGDAYVVTTDLPGYTREEVELKVADRTLTIRASHGGGSEETGPVEIATDDEETESETGTEATDEDEGTRRYVRRERFHGVARRSLRLPSPVDATDADASLEDGVLTVTLPKHTATDPGTDIPVN